MTIRKRNIDNSVKYIPQSKQTRVIRANTIENDPHPKKQNKNISQNI